MEFPWVHASSNNNYAKVFCSRLADIRFMNVIKALCFFYYLLILPCIWAGKKIWWICFADTIGKKKSAESSVLKSIMKRKNPDEMEKVGIVSLRDTIKGYQDQYDGQMKKKVDAKKAKKAEAILAAYNQKRMQGGIPETTLNNKQDGEKFLAEAHKKKVDAILKAYEKKKQPVGPDDDLEFLNEDLWSAGLDDDILDLELPSSSTSSNTNSAGPDTTSASVESLNSFSSAFDTFFSIDLNKKRKKSTANKTVSSSSTKRSTTDPSINYSTADETTTADQDPRKSTADQDARSRRSIEKTVRWLDYRTTTTSDATGESESTTTTTTTSESAEKPTADQSTSEIPTLSSDNRFF